MTSSASSLLLPSDWDPFPRCRSAVVFFASPMRFTCRPRSKSPTILRLSSSIAISAVDLSWFPPQPESSAEDYAGWAAVEAPGKEKKNGTYILACYYVPSVIALLILGSVFYQGCPRLLLVLLGAQLHLPLLPLVTLLCAEKVVSSFLVCLALCCLSFDYMCSQRLSSFSIAFCLYNTSTDEIV